MSGADVEILRPDVYLTLRQAAKRVQMDEAFLRDLVRSGEGPPAGRFNDGQLVLIRETALLSWARLWITRATLGQATHGRLAAERPLMTANRRRR